MKIATIIAQVLVGLVFVVFGSNAFLHFLPAVLPPGVGIPGNFVYIKVRAVRGRSAGDRRGTGACEPVCDAGTDAAGASDCQHSVVSWTAEPCRMAAGSGDGDSLDFSFSPIQEELCGDFCGEGDVSEVQKQTGRRVLMRHAPFRFCFCKEPASEGGRYNG